MKHELRENELATLARRFRKVSGKNQSEAARELKVSRVSVFHAEESPGESLVKLRKRIIEKYSSYKVVGPFYRLEGK